MWCVVRFVFFTVRLNTFNVLKNGFLLARWEASWVTTDSFVFLDRFAFAQSTQSNDSSNNGIWSFTFYNQSAFFQTAPTPQENVQIDLFYDSDASWFAVWGNSSMSCMEKRRHASALNNRSVANSHITYNSTETVLIIDTNAPHFWYMALSNCNASGKPWAAQYIIHATNPGGWWYSEFSVDEQQLLALYLTFTFFFYLPLLAVHLWGVTKLRAVDAFSGAVKLITAFIALQFLGCFFEFVHLAVYASDGFGVPTLNRFADFLQAVAEIEFIILLLALAQGWCVSTLTFRDPNTIKAVTLIVLLTYLILLFWRIGGESPESTLYYYESVPGALALVVRCALCIYFVISVRMTYREETDPKKRNFYITFGLLYTVWFLVLIFIVLIGAATPPVFRARSVEVMTTLQAFLAAFVLSLAFSPWMSVRLFNIGTAKSDFINAAGHKNVSYRAISQTT